MYCVQTACGTIFTFHCKFRTNDKKKRNKLKTIQQVLVDYVFFVRSANCWVSLPTEMQFPTECGNRIRSMLSFPIFQDISLVTFLNIHWTLIMRAQISHIYRWATIKASTRANTERFRKNSRGYFLFKKSNETTTITTFIKRITYILARSEVVR